MKIRYYTTGHRTLNDNGLSKEVRFEQALAPLSASLLRPYLDLGGQGGPIHSRVVTYASDLLTRGEEPGPPFQMNTAMALRGALIRESRLAQYDTAFPDDLPQQLRTPDWNLLCEQLGRWSALLPEQKVNVATLLNKLGLYRATLRYVPDFSPSEIASDETAARLAAKRANALFKTNLGRNPTQVERILSCIAIMAPGGGRTRLAAAINLVVHHAKVTKNVLQMQHWARMAEQEIRLLNPDRYPYDRIYLSCYYRGVSFVPYFLGDKAAVTDMMCEAEKHGQALFRDARIPAILAAENWHPLLETLTNGALWLKEHERAMEYMRSLVAHDSLDPKVHMRMGDLLLRAGQAEAALSSYQQAVRLGAPYTGTAWYMLGQCYEALDSPETACHAYLQSVRTDPWGISALLCLYHMAKRLNRSALYRWSEERLQWHKQRGWAKGSEQYPEQH